MFSKILKIMKKIILKYLDDNTIVIIQRKLIGADIFVKTEDFIVVLIFMMIILFIILTGIFLIFDLSPVLSTLLTFIFPITVMIYIHYKNEKRLEKIEWDLSDYIRQLSSLIRVGYGIESAFAELSRTMNNPLNDEIKRALLETNFGKPFNESLMDIVYRNNSENLKHVFQIIIFSNESGGNVSDVLESIAEDLTDRFMLKKERKAGVMTSVMFLSMSSTIATPFALAMIRLYSDFIGNMGQINPLASVIPFVSTAYVIIQSILVSVLISIILYSNVKKALLILIVLIPISLFIYFCSQFMFKGILGV